MMCPDHCAIDHVGGGIASRQLGQRLEHGIEHAGRDPSSIATEHAVPLAIFVRQVSPLRSGSRVPHHTFKIRTVILRPRLPPKVSLESRSESPVKLCPRNLKTLAETRNIVMKRSAIGGSHLWVPDELITSAIAVSNELYTLLGQRKLLTGVACFRVIEE